MRKDESIFNILLGLSIIAWGAMGLYKGTFQEPSLIRFLSSILNFFIGFLIIFRNPVLKSGSHFSILISLPSFLLGGMLFKMAHPFNVWPISLEIAFATGVLVTLISFLYLGKNFAIFPNLRAISKQGPYRLIRHPAYAAEILLTASCCLANFNVITISIFTLFLFFLHFRIEEEEKLLSESKEFIKYKSIVKWKLVPHLW